MKPGAQTFGSMSGLAWRSRTIAFPKNLAEWKGDAYRGVVLVNCFEQKESPGGGGNVPQLLSITFFAAGSQIGAKLQNTARGRMDDHVPGVFSPQFPVCCLWRIFRCFRNVALSFRCRMGRKSLRQQARRRVPSGFPNLKGKSCENRCNKKSPQR